WEIHKVTGEGGTIVTKVLQTRGLASTLPTLAQLSGTEISLWAKFGLLMPLDEIAEQENWQQVMRPLTLDVSQYGQHYIALPLAVHRINWLWTNKALFKKAQLQAPDDIQSLIAAIKKFKQLNIKPIAIGNQPWQISILFENIALGMSGNDYYKKAFVQLSSEAINSPKMNQILDQFRDISLLIKPTLDKHSWEHSSSDLLLNRAAMQIAGDWVLGEINALDEDAMSLIDCHVAPGTQGNFIYNMDNILHFKNPNNLTEASAVNAIMSSLSSIELQHDFNKFKGSLPARLDVDISDFNHCGRQAEKDYQRAKADNKLLPSFTDSMAVNPVMQKMIVDQIHDFFNHPKMSNEMFIANFLAISAAINNKKL
ncbi:MAG: glucose/mannose transport system substrate-binding protein, partial [Psychromonas sp.]